jgi:negative regulator of sigma E activity
MVNWGLPARIIRAFLEELERQYGGADPANIPASRKLGMNANVIVVDPNDLRRRYVFFVRFARNDDDFWVADINCLGVDDANNIFWTPSQ